MPKEVSRGRAIALGSVFAGVLLVTTVLLVVALEKIAARYVQLPASQHVKNVRLNHIWPPGGSRTHTEWVANNPDFQVPYTHVYNKQVWPEKYDIALEKPPNTHRIFYVGDSFTERCVPMEENVPSQVEDELNKRYGSSGLKFEAINTGTSSYSPVLAYVLIRYFIAEYSPDVVVISVDMTDDFDDFKYLETMIADSEGNPVAVSPRDLYSSAYVDTLQGAAKATFALKLQLYLAEHSYLYNWMLGGKANAAPDPDKARAPARTASERWFQEDLQHARGYPRWAWCQHQWTQQTEHYVAFTLDILSRIAEFCQNRGIKLLLTGVPHYRQFPANPGEQAVWSNRPHSEIEKLATKKGVASFNSYKALVDQFTGKPQNHFYYHGNMHLNPRGNRLWAAAHIAAMVDPANKLLPENLYSSAPR